MKTQIITLETHDDLISVRDRMSWAKSPRILLVWPRFEKITLRPVDLRVLQQHARFLGADLGLVTRRADVRRNAEGFGIPVFNTSAAAQREAWPAHHPANRTLRRDPRPDLHALQEQAQIKEAPWRSSPVVRVGFFGLGVLAVLALAALFLPRASVKIVPVSQLQTITIPVSASLDIQTVLLTGSVPAHQTSVDVENTQTITITSQGSIPNDKAEGVARFKNLTQSDLTIPAGTAVYTTGTPSIRFLTANTTHLPAGPTHFVEVPIIAAAPGTSGNVEAGAIQAIEGSLSLSCAVTNPDPTSGGTDLTATAAVDADRQRLYDAVTSAIEKQSQQQIEDSIGPKDLVLLNTIKAGQPLKEVYDPPAGQPGTRLKLTMQIQYTAQYIASADLMQLAQTVLDGSMPAGFVTQPNTLTYRALNQPIMDDAGVSHFDLQAGRVLEHQIEPFQVVNLIRGLPLADAKHILQQNLSLTKPPEVDLQPAWWPWMPLVPFGITVQE